MRPAGHRCVSGAPGHGAVVGTEDRATRIRDRLFFAAALGLAAWPALRGDFLAEDYFRFARAWHDGGPDLRPFLADLTQPWSGREVVPYWRPLGSLGWLPDLLLFPANPLASHALNLILHALAVASAFALAQRLFPETPPRFGLLLAAVGAFGSTRAEPVGWMAGRIDLVPAALLLAGCAKGIGWIREERRGGSIAGPLALFAAAFLWKESGVVGPLLLLGFDLASPGRPRPGARPRIYLALSALLALSLAARVLVLGSLGGGMGGALLRFGPLASGLLRSVSMSAFPIDRPTFGSASGWAAFALFALAATAVVAASRRGERRLPRIGGTLLAWVAATLPAAPLAPNDALAGARVLYLPGFAFALALGAACAPAFGGGAPRRRRLVAAAALLGFVAIGAVGLRLGLERWRRAGEVGRRVREDLASRVLGEEGPAVVVTYPAAVARVPIFLVGGPGRVEGIAPALLEPFAANRRAPLGLWTFFRNLDGSPHHALRAAGFRFVGYGEAGFEWAPPPPAPPAVLDVAPASAPGGAGRAFRLRGEGIDPRLFACLSITVANGEGARVAARVDWGAGEFGFLARVREGRLALPIGSDLGWWIAPRPGDLSLALEGLPSGAQLASAALLADLPALALEEAARGADPLRIPQPRERGAPLRLVVLAPSFTAERFLGPGAPVALDEALRRELRVAARTLHGIEFGWFLEALEEPGDRRSARARSPLRLWELPAGDPSGSRGGGASTMPR